MNNKGLWKKLKGKFKHLLLKNHRIVNWIDQNEGTIFGTDYPNTQCTEN